MKQAQIHFSLDSADEENYKQILAEWLQAIEQLAHGYKQINLLIAVGQSSSCASTQPATLQFSPQIESDLKQLQQEAYLLLVELSDQMQKQDCSPTGPLMVSQLRQHTVLLSDLNQRLQDTLFRIRLSHIANRFNLN